MLEKLQEKLENLQEEKLGLENSSLPGKLADCQEKKP